MIRQLIAFLLTVACHAQIQYNEARFDKLRQKMEADVLELAAEVERLYQYRCDSSLAGCALNNYHECMSQLPSHVCITGSIHRNPKCGANISSSCSSLSDFTTSVVAVPTDLLDVSTNNPIDPQVIESICFTRALDSWLVQKREADEGYWDQEFGGIQPSNMYFGSQHGPFRIYPGMGRDQCGEFDPRVRPWYVAASSGPKNVIMILDKSGSMQGQRIELLKSAAKRVVNTLSVADRVALIAFDSDVQEISDNNYLYTANQTHKDELVKAIDGLEAGSKTNFYDAFERAFDLLNRTAENEFTVPCNTAILFLTDGEMTYPPDKTTSDVLMLVNKRIIQSEGILKKPIFMFAYSISESGEDAHTFPSELACSLKNGVWSKIGDDNEIVSSLNNYQRLFALGLGDDKNSGFVAWIEPYTFFTSGTLGTAVSAPVYDRSKSPALFVGVVGIDIALEALNIALTNTTDIISNLATEESIRRVVLQSTARCPTINLTLCELESYRQQGSAGSAALCTNNCSAQELLQVEEIKCDSISDYPSNLWENTNTTNLGYVDRVCCTTDPLEQCLLDEQHQVGNEDQSSKKAIYFGAVAGTVVVTGLIIAVFYYRFRSTKNKRDRKREVEAKSDVTTSQISLFHGSNAAISIFPVPILPPSAPQDPDKQADV